MAMKASMVATLSTLVSFLGVQRYLMTVTALGRWTFRGTFSTRSPFESITGVSSSRCLYSSSSSSSSSPSSSPNNDDRCNNNNGNPAPLTLPLKWIRLAGHAPVEYRMEVTNQVVSAISSSGGYLSMSNMLSNLVTSLLMEDIEPTKLNVFYDRLRSIPHLKLHPNTVALLEAACSQQQQQLAAKKNAAMKSSSDDDNGGDTTSDEESHNNNNNAVGIAGVFQLTWKGADGRLKQTIVADG